MSLLRAMCVAALTAMIPAAMAQDRVDARLTGERVILVVPFAGAGTFEDPKRPLFAPKPGEESPVQAFAWVPTDDGKYAIAMFVGKLPADFEAMKADQRVAKFLRKGEHRKDEIETILKKLKKDFSYEQLLGAIQ